MSEQTDLSHYVPRRLDDGAKFLFWDMDIAMIAMLGVLVGMGLDYPILGMLAGVMGEFGYAKLTAGKHPGKPVHLMYCFPGLPEPKEQPGSHIREHNG